MPKNLSISFENDQTLGKVAAALASKTRRAILHLITNEPCSISDLSKKLNMPLSTLSEHVKMLEEAYLVTVTVNTARRGREKLVARGINNICIDLVQPPKSMGKQFRFDVPLGSFTDCEISASCGLADGDGMVITDDNPSAFYSPDRIHAQLVWFSSGYVEYRLPNYMLKGKQADTLMITCELCSECPNYNTEWKSDITFWINGMEVCTYESPGDMGGRHGLLTPPSWSHLATQFGFLKTILVNDEGAYLDNYRVSAAKIGNLNLQGSDYITLRIGIKPNAKNVGGVNLFGRKFGDFPQGLDVTLHWYD